MEDDIPAYTGELEDQFRTVKKEYGTIRQRALAQVVRWEWTNGVRYDVRPFYFERMGQRRGDVVEQPSGGSYYRYALSADNHILVEETYRRDRLMSEAFWQYPPDKIQIMVFEAGNLIRIARLDNGGELAEQYLQYDRKHGMDARERELYTAEDGKITKIAWERNEWFENVGAEAFCLYDDDGELSLIEGSPSMLGFVPRIYERPATQRSTTPRADASTPKTLVDGIVAAVAEHHIGQPVCALILLYSVQDGFFPPQVAVLTEAERQARLNEGDTSVETVWTLPWMMMSNEPIVMKDAAALELCAKLQSALNPEQARDLLAHVAGDLIAVDWSDKLSITDDFIAFSFDHDIDSAQDRIQQSAPQERIRKLHKKGLL